MQSMPNKPMETAGGFEGGRTFNCYTAPGEVFHSEEEMKDHYRSEWHRYNLKRKVQLLTALAPQCHPSQLACFATAHIGFPF